MRLLDKYAVRIGGGQNHRLHLGDRVLIKDNHIAALRPLGTGIGEIIKKARKSTPNATILEIEVNNIEDAIEAAAAGVDIIMLDNISLGDMKKAVKSLPRNIKIEASGGITPDNIRKVALAGVDYISIGALTHSVKALDFSLEIM
jgi:nicotinate-nucleotide pyrophosphorylase (carboxylating)